ncbi:MAG: tandem-95 repeat protein, partial [Planctomycetales bacterium]|nr:tandem-95 repeat protein [Planctomycetales bacterium]
MLLESLERRELLAVDIWQIDLSGGGTIDLFGSQGGGQVQTQVQSRGNGDDQVIGTMNNPGQNNHPPVALDDVATTNQLASVALTSLLLGNDSDEDDAALTISAIDTTNATGDATLADGELTYQPGTAFQYLPAGQTAVDTLVYVVSDSHQATATATVLITITGANDPPSAHNDILAFAEHDALSNVTATLLANDVDPDAGETGTLGITGIDSSGTIGSVSFAGGTVTYSPNGQFESLAAGSTAVDAFTYTIQDIHGATATATAVITITGSNDAPTADNDSAIFTEDQAATDVTSTLLSGDADIDSGETAALVVSAVNASGTVGLVTLNHGTVLYTPNGQLETLGAGSTSNDSFIYTARDPQGGTATATMVITIQGVNDAPAADDDATTVAEDSGVIDLTSALLAGDSDIDAGESDLLELAAIDAAGTVGVVTLVNGSVTYDPDGRFQSLAIGETAVDTFVYTVSDPHGATATATVAVTITGENDAPTADNDGVNVAEDDGASDITSTLLDGDTDADQGETAQLTVTAIATAGVVGQVTLSNGIVHYSPSMAFESLPVGGTATDTFTYTIEDPHGETAEATVTVTIAGRNDAPASFNDSASIAADTLLSVAARGVLTNDTDVDTGESALLVVSASDSASVAGATVSVASNGSYTYDPRGVAAFVALPQGESTVDVFHYTAADPQGATDSADAVITVVGVNDAPTASDNAFTVSASDTAMNLTAAVLANDDDPDSGETNLLQVSAFDASGMIGLVALNAGTLTYDPNGQFHSLTAGQTAIETFTYTVSDPFGATATATVTVTVTGENDEPQADGDSFTVGEDAAALDVTATLLAGDSDPDAGETASLAITAVNTTGTIG